VIGTAPETDNETTAEWGGVTAGWGDWGGVTGVG